MTRHERHELEGLLDKARACWHWTDRAYYVLLVNWIEWVLAADVVRPRWDPGQIALEKKP